MHRAPFRADAYVPARDFAIENAKSDVKIALRRSIGLKDFFEEVYHVWIKSEIRRVYRRTRQCRDGRCIGSSDFSYLPKKTRLAYALRFMDSTPKNQTREEQSLTVRQLYPELNGEQLREAEANLLRYFEVALDIYEERNTNPIDTSPALPTMKERSKSLKN